MKWAHSGVYLSQTMWNHAKNSCSILSLWTAIKGYLFKFGLFTFGRALSSQRTPYQVLKLKLQKLQKDNDDDSTQDCRFLRFTFTFLHDVQNIAPGHK